MNELPTKQAPRPEGPRCLFCGPTTAGQNTSAEARRAEVLVFCRILRPEGPKNPSGVDNIEGRRPEDIVTVGL